MNTPVPALEQSWLRTKTHDYASYMKVAELKANSSNNTLFADDKGEIAFLMPQFVPRRDDRFDYTKPVDGSDPATDWQGLTPLRDLPQVIQPRTGWVMNTNDWPYAAAGKDSPRRTDFPRYMDTFGENPRGLHATRLLAGASGFSKAKLIADAFDPYLPAFARQLPMLLHDYDALPASDPRKASLAAPIAVLRGWDYRWGTASIPTTLAVFWGDRLWDAVAPLAAASDLDPDEAVTRSYDYMATRATPDMRLAALTAAVATLEHDFGDWGIPWGEVNRYQRLDDAIHPHFDDARPSVPVPFTSARWGSLASFGAHTWPGTAKYYGSSGNSFVAVVEFGSKVSARAIHVGGQSGHPSSAHFTDQAGRYASGNLRTVYFWPEQLKGHTERVYHPGMPAGGVSADFSDSQPATDDRAAARAHTGESGRRRRIRPSAGWPKGARQEETRTGAERVAERSRAPSGRQCDPPGFGQRGMPLPVACRRVDAERRHQQRLAPRRPEDRDVVALAMRAAAGLVADPPVGWRAGAQLVEPGAGGAQPGRQLPARRRGEDIAQQQRLQIAQHGVRRGGIAQVARRANIELRFKAIQPGQRIAQGAHERCRRRRAAEAGQQQIVGGVVAHRNRRLAQLGHRHARRARAMAGYRRPRQQRLAAEHDAPVQPLGAAVDPRQHRAHGQQLVRAAHQEALVGTVQQAAAAAGVEHGHAEPAAVGLFQPGESIAGICRPRGRGRPQRQAREAQQAGLDQFATAHRRFSLARMIGKRPIPACRNGAAEARTGYPAGTWCGRIGRGERPSDRSRPVSRAWRARR
jgi:hypothetical protein